MVHVHSDFRAEIERLRESQASVPSRLPVRERSSDASLRTRLRAALDETRRQREEITELREELAWVEGFPPVLGFGGLRGGWVVTT